MLFLKVENKNDETKYYTYGDIDNLSFKKEKIFKTFLKGDLKLAFLGKRWYVTNFSDQKLKYGHGHLKVNKQRVLKYDKPFYYGDFKVTMLRYKDKDLGTISPGLANQKMDLSLKSEYLIGRGLDCDIIIENPQIDKHNTRIIHDGDDYYIEDLKSSNGLRVNGKKVKYHKLVNNDTIMIPTAIYVFINHELLYSESNTGIKIDIHHISKQVKDFHTHKPIKLVNDVSLTINQGEYVAVVGGSGAGKSTFLDCVNGRRPMTSGYVYYDLNNFYKFYDAYQKIIGYVPQSDIMHTDLSIYKTLYYYAQIRMQHKLTKEELHELIMETLEEVSLVEKKEVVVSSLSGGQKKRVSIAMELLANPKVIFLDEPTSGLSPDLDYEVMSLLAKLSKKGKTIIIITHNMENVDKCDKIAFLGKGGRLCYYGSPKDIFKYFNVKKYGEIFHLLSEEKNVLKYETKLKKSEEFKLMLERQDAIYKEVE